MLKDEKKNIEPFNIDFGGRIQRPAAQVVEGLPFQSWRACRSSHGGPAVPVAQRRRACRSSRAGPAVPVAQGLPFQSRRTCCSSRAGPAVPVAQGLPFQSRRACRSSRGRFFQEFWTSPVQEIAKIEAALRWRWFCVEKREFISKAL